MSTQPNARGPYRTGIERRQQIIASAAAVFTEFGYHGGSMRQIALQVGVTPAALTRHFESKADLLVAVLEWWRNETDSVMRPDVHGLAYFTELRSVMRYHLDHRGLLELFLTLSTEAINTSHPAASFVRARYARMAGDLSRELSSAAERGEVRPMSAAEIERDCRTLMALMDGVELQWLLDSRLDLLALFDLGFERIRDGWLLESRAGLSRS
jgi:AcrR family transcriptional regulator